jgi:type IV pilus assembly protein PilQ
VGAQFLYKKLSPLTLSLSAAETVNLSKTLSSPTLTLLNNQAGSITSGIQIPYQSVDENGNPKTELVSASLTLNVKPKLLPDGRILLNLQLSKDSPNTGLAVNGQPAINTFQITQNFIITNGETVVIGGVREKSNNEGEASTPILKDIPLLGWLFKTKNWDKSDDELLVFITAEVVNQ